MAFKTPRRIYEALNTGEIDKDSAADLLIYLIEKLGIEFLEIPINHIEKEIARHPLYIIRSIMKNFVKLILFKLRLIIS